MSTRIVVATTNPGKVREFARLLNEPRIELVGMKAVVPSGFEVEETGSSFAENAWLKALSVSAESGLPALADDSGLEVDALGGRPGIYSARFAGVGASDEDNNRLLLTELQSVAAERRSARFICHLAFAAPSESGIQRVAEARAAIEGRIIEAAQGQGGFGYDPLFEPLDYPGCTTASLGPEQKDRISHRGRAARAILLSIEHWLAASESA